MYIIKKKGNTMGKMKDKFMEEQERLVSEAVNAFIDDDWQYQEYLKSLSERMGYGTPTPATQEDVQSNHDDWWNSLTDEQKQQLYLDQEEATKESNDEYLNHWLKNNDNASK